MNNLEARIEFMRNGLNVRRYHQHVTLEVDTVGKHSCGVALFTMLINPEVSADVLKMAVSHDLGEWELGDIPAPTKRSLPEDSRRIIDEIEEKALNDHGYHHEAIYNHDYRLLKLADYCDGLRFCIEERRRGNTGLSNVASVYITYLLKLLDQIPTDIPWFRNAKEVVHTLIRQKEQTYVR